MSSLTSDELSANYCANLEKVMSDMTLALTLTLVLLAALFVGVPLLQSLEALTRSSPNHGVLDMPNLVEEDAGPQFTGEVA
jgi:hypothetical protein